jgi:hypothetical protein
MREGDSDPTDRPNSALSFMASLPRVIVIKMDKGNMSTELTYLGTPLSQMFRLHLRTVLPNLPMDSGQTLMR